MKRKLIHIIREENFLSLAGNMAIALFGIAGFALLARSLSIKDFGEWVLFIAAGSFIDMLRFGITSTAVVRYIAGSETTQRNQIIGSNAYISIIATTSVALLIFVCNVIFHHRIAQTNYKLFFQWYPLLAISNLFWNNAIVLLQADRKYGKILFLKCINNGTFFIALLLNYSFFHSGLIEMVWVMIGISAITSIISILFKWDGIDMLRKATKQSNQLLINFGKYTTFTLVATNLLRSADMFIISLSAMGSEAVALYSIPMKLTELQQIPLRSFTATAFPKMSKASMQANLKEVRAFFYTYAGALTYLFIVLSLATFCFADLFVWIIAGKQYINQPSYTHDNVVTIVRIFSIYGLLLPIDRMTGIGLDSINKPNINAKKVLVMLLANVIGDVIAVFYFKSLLLVAASSILFTLVGIYTGMKFLDKEININLKQVFVSANNFYTIQFRKINFYK